jgi:lactoylglutathione lyase
MKMVHVTIFTGCLEESIKFYEDVVGLNIQNDFRKFGGNIVFLAKDEGDTQVELIDDPQKAYKGSGISMGFHVDDVEAKREELIEKGLDVTPIITPNPHVKFFFIEDPNGVTVQFI